MVRLIKGLGGSSGGSFFNLKDGLNLKSTGLLKGGILSINASDPSKFDLTAGVGVVVDNYTDPLNPTEKIVVWDDKTAVEDPYLGLADTTYVNIDKDGELYFTTLPLDEAERRKYIAIGWLDHPLPDSEEIVFAKTEPFYNCDIQAQLNDFFENFGAFNIEGNIYSAYGNDLRVKRSAGKVFDGNSNYDADRSNPHVFATNAEGPIEFVYYYRDGSGGWINSNVPTQYVDPDHYDDGSGTLANVSSGHWTIQILMYYPISNANDFQYGQKEYATLGEAITALKDPVEISPYNMWDVFRGWLVVKQGATNLSDPDQALFIPSGKFGLMDIMSGGGSAGEINTASNVGSGVGVFKDKLGVDLRFKSLVGTTNRVSVTSGTNDITFSTPQDINTNSNVQFGSLYLGTGTISSSALLQADSTTKGFLPPRMTTAQRTAISSPATGLLVYDTDNKSLWHYTGTAWETVATKAVFFNFIGTSTLVGQHNTLSISANGSGNFNFRVPYDYHNLVALELVGIPSTGASGSGKDIDLISQYGAVGQPYNNYSTTDTTSTYTVGPVNQFWAFDISAMFPNLSAGHYCGLYVKHNAIGGAINYLGVRLRYV